MGEGLYHFKVRILMERDWDIWMCVVVVPPAQIMDLRDNATKQHIMVVGLVASQFLLIKHINNYYMIRVAKSRSMQIQLHRCNTMNGYSNNEYSWCIHCWINYKLSKSINDNIRFIIGNASLPSSHTTKQEVFKKSQTFWNIQ